MAQDAIQNLKAPALWQKAWRSQQHSGPITKLIPLPLGGKIASIGQDAAVKVYRGSDLCPLQSLNSSKNSNSWASDATVLTLGGQTRLVVSYFDRSLSFYNVLKAEFDPDRPDEASALGLGGTLHSSATAGPATCLAALPFPGITSSSLPTDNQDFSKEITKDNQQLVFGDQSGKVQLLKRGPPTMGQAHQLLPAALTLTPDVEVLHSHHKSTVTQLLYVPNVGLLSSSLDGSIGIFDPERGAIAATASIHGGAAVRCMAYHEPLTLAISGGAERKALLWHPRGDPGHAVGELLGHASGVLAVSTAEMESSQHVVGTLSGAGVIALWDLRMLRMLRSMESGTDFPSHEDARPFCLTFDPEQKRLLTGTRRPCLWTWGDVEFKTNPDSPPKPSHASGRSFLPEDQELCKQGKEELEGVRSIIGGIAEGEKQQDGAAAVAASGVKHVQWRQAHSFLRVNPIPDTDDLLD